MEELKKSLTEEKRLLEDILPLLRTVHEDVGKLSAIFIPFLGRMDAFMENMQKFIDGDEHR